MFIVQFTLYLQSTISLINVSHLCFLFIGIFGRVIKVVGKVGELNGDREKERPLDEVGGANMHTMNYISIGPTYT